MEKTKRNKIIRRIICYIIAFLIVRCDYELPGILLVIIGADDIEALFTFSEKAIGFFNKDDNSDFNIGVLYAIA